MGDRELMIKTHLNPTWLDPHRYVAFLNLSFPRQWSRRAYDWYIGRPFNGKPCDLLVRTDGERILAGVSACYRQVALPGAEPLDVCILSAGATHPAERGHGHYAALLRDVLALCRQRRCVAALGFVRQDNASGRGLTRLGAHVIPSFYISAPWHPARRASARLLPRALPASRASELFASCNGHAVDTVRFHYARLRDWQQQFLERPNPVRALRIGHDAVALIERVGVTDRLQLLAAPGARFANSLAALVGASRQRARSFFLYSMDPLEAAAARRLGLTVRDGHLVIQDTGYRPASAFSLARARWSVQSGDRL
jgi:GNAT superfamily N-acetyltransferase